MYPGNCRLHVKKIKEKIRMVKEKQKRGGGQREKKERGEERINKYRFIGCNTKFQKREDLFSTLKMAMIIFIADHAV